MNDKQMRKIIWAERIVLALMAAGILGWLFYVDLAPSGILEAENSFEGRSPLISDPYPDIRLKKTDKDERGDYYQTMVIDPVYFDVAVPRMFQTAKLEIRYRNQRHPFFQAGLKKNEGDWNFAFQRVESEPFDYGSEGQWAEREMVFQLDPSFYDKGKLHFILSAPELDVKNNEISISNIKVTLEKEPITLGNFFPRLKRKLGI